MNREDFKLCIEASKACAVACDAASASGAGESNAHAMADCIALSRDCAEICRLAASYMERESKMVTAILLACVEACEHCQRECDKYLMDYCSMCAAACRTCLMECHEMLAKLNEIEHHQSPYSVIAGMRE
jgi:hypothetical protein